MGTPLGPGPRVPSPLPLSFGKYPQEELRSAGGARLWKRLQQLNHKSKRKTPYSTLGMPFSLSGVEKVPGTADSVRFLIFLKALN